MVILRSGKHLPPAPPLIVTPSSSLHPLNTRPLCALVYQPHPLPSSDSRPTFECGVNIPPPSPPSPSSLNHLTTARDDLSLRRLSPPDSHLVPVSPHPSAIALHRDVPHPPPTPDLLLSTAFIDPSLPSSIFSARGNHSPTTFRRPPSTPIWSDITLDGGGSSSSDASPSEDHLPPLLTSDHRGGSGHLEHTFTGHGATAAVQFRGSPGSSGAECLCCLGRPGGACGAASSHRGNRRSGGRFLLSAGSDQRAAARSGCSFSIGSGSFCDHCPIPDYCAGLRDSGIYGTVWRGSRTTCGFAQGAEGDCAVGANPAILGCCCADSFRGCLPTRTSISLRGVWGGEGTSFWKTGLGLGDHLRRAPHPASLSPPSSVHAPRHCYSH